MEKIITTKFLQVTNEEESDTKKSENERGRRKGDSEGQKGVLKEIKDKKEREK